MLQGRRKNPIGYMSFREMIRILSKLLKSLDLLLLGRTRN